MCSVQNTKTNIAQVTESDYGNTQKPPHQPTNRSTICKCFALILFPTLYCWLKDTESQVVTVAYHLPIGTPHTV